MEELLQQYIKGEVSEEEKLRVAKWLGEDPEHIRTYRALRKVYDVSLWHRQAAGEVEKRRLAVRPTFYAVMKIAAVFAVAFTIGYLFKTTPRVAPAMQMINVPPGQRAEVTLSDGTKVWLNAKSTLSFPTLFADNRREVTLDGEGYFEVSHNRKKPFIVKTEQYNIKVLGTEFNVLAYSGKNVFETALLKGSVEIESANRTERTCLKPDQMVSMENGHLRTSAITQYDYFEWKEGLICFDDISIRDLLNKLQLYYDVKIVVENGSILDYRFSGKFRVRDGVDHVLKTLQLRTKFKYEKKDETDNTIIIR